LNPRDAEVLNGGVESIHIGTISTESEAVAAIKNFTEMKGGQGNGNSQRR